MHALNECHEPKDLTKHCLVLEVDSSANIFRNEDLLRGAGRASRHLKLESNSGEIRSNKMGMICDLRIWLRDGPIVITLSLSRAVSKCRVVTDRKSDPGVKVEIAPEVWERPMLSDISLRARGIRSNVEISPSDNAK